MQMLEQRAETPFPHSLQQYLKALGNITLATQDTFRADVRRWLEEGRVLEVLRMVHHCLDHPFTLARAYQELLNLLGEYLGFCVYFGKYTGGIDGVWLDCETKWAYIVDPKLNSGMIRFDAVSGWISRIRKDEQAEMRAWLPRDYRIGLVYIVASGTVPVQHLDRAISTTHSLDLDGFSRLVLAARTGTSKKKLRSHFARRSGMLQHAAGEYPIRGLKERTWRIDTLRERAIKSAARTTRARFVTVAGDSILRSKGRPPIHLVALAARERASHRGTFLFTMTPEHTRHLADADRWLLALACGRPGRTALISSEGWRAMTETNDTPSGTLKITMDFGSPMIQCGEALLPLAPSLQADGDDSESL